MLLTVLVVEKRLAGRALLQNAVVNDKLAAISAAVQDDHLERRKRRARVAVREDGEGAELVVRYANLQRAESASVGYGAPEKRDEIVLAEPLQDEHLAAREQRPVDLEGRILRRRADEDDAAALDEREKRVLLRLVEAVDFVDEDNRLASEGTVFVRLVHHFLDFLDAARHRGECDEPGVRRPGDHVRERRLTNTRRAPEDHRGDDIALDHPAQYLPLADEMRLAYDFVKRAWPQAFRKRDTFVRLSIRPAGEKALFYWLHAHQAQS